MLSPVTSQCLISFGSNLGERAALIAEAAKRVSDNPWVRDLRTSRLFETPPIGGPEGQHPFLNAVAVFDTDASARQVLELLQATEQELGRQRRERWDARSIDLDVVLHGELVGGGTGLIVPHPRYTARRFVLEPACDVAAHYRDPRFGWTLKQLFDHLNQGPPSLALLGGDASTRMEICRRLQTEHNIQTFEGPPPPEPMTVVGHAPAIVRSADPKLGSPPPPDSEGRSATENDPPSITPANNSITPANNSITPVNNDPWVSAFVPPLPTSPIRQRNEVQPSNDPREPSVNANPDAKATRGIPRLIARMQRATEKTRWPAPHQIWPSSLKWPEYRLEIDDLDWAVKEVASALDSMRCPVTAATTNGDWW
jgi:2-amino-4-hydroxy-6-hydroxymethyldihydropteridine diphosphokinase